MKNNAEIARRAKLIVMGVALAGIVGLLFFAHHARLNPKLGADFPILPTATASEGVGRYDLYSDLQCRFYIGYVDTAREMFGVGNAIAYRDNYGGMYSTEYSSNPNDTSCINLKKLRGAVEDTVEAVGEFFESFTWAVGQVVDWVGKAGEFGAKMTEGERDLETVGIFEGTSDIVKDIAEEMMTNPACGQILLEIQAAENLIATSGGDMGQAIGGTIAVSEAREQYSGCIKLYGTVLEPATAKPFPSITYPTPAATETSDYPGASDAEIEEIEAGVAEWVRECGATQEWAETAMQEDYARSGMSGVRRLIQDCRDAVELVDNLPVDVPRQRDGDSPNWGWGDDDDDIILPDGG